MDEARPPCRLTVIAPARNEAGSLATLVAETVIALDLRGLAFEIIIVDDGSSDDTPEVLAGLLDAHPALRAIRLDASSARRPAGQSAAFRAGINASRGDLVAMLDADGQNDPADLSRLLEAMDATGADLVQGDRSGSRRDGFVKHVTSLVGRLARRWLLGDSIRDTGCSLRLMRREVAAALPLEYRGMHRFIPLTARQLGFRVEEVPVSHRPRTAGRTHYGVWNRALPGLIDCLAVRWMRRRRQSSAWRELATMQRSDAAPATPPPPSPSAATTHQGIRSP